MRTVARYEPVHVLAGNGSVMREARDLVGDDPHVTLHSIETNDAWTRDFGPTFLQAVDQAPPALVDWHYNAWGGKYPPWDRDAAVPRQLAERLDYRRFRAGLTLEGGAIESNGCGTVLTTESCLLNPNRNPTMTRETVEQYLTAFLMAQRVLWLDVPPLAGDDTDGHVDQLARFVGKTTVVVATCQDPTDENHEVSLRLGEQLAMMTDQAGNRWRVIPLPLPNAKYIEKQRIPASYCNFYIANGVVVVPQFGDPSDALACETLAKLFPGRTIVGLDALDLALGLGSFHCLAQQQPVNRSAMAAGGTT